MTAAYPVTAVVVPATLIAPKRWRAITLTSALGSSLGALGLVATVHLAGWETLSTHYPALVSHEDWIKITRWAADYGPLALFVVAATPLPQTPALIFFGMAHPDFFAIFLAIFSGKLFKYGAIAWFTQGFPQHMIKSPPSAAGAILNDSPRKTDL